MLRSPILITLGELILGFVVGLITYRVSGATDAITGILSVAVGLLTSLLAATFAQRFNEEMSQRRLAERMDHLIHTLSDRVGTSADAASALRYGGVEIPRGEVTRVWLDRLWRTSSRYWGAIYTAPGEVVDTSIYQLGLAILSAKVRVDHVDVRRIFVVDDHQELEHLLPAMRAQEGHISVRYVLRTTLDHHSLLSTQLAQLPSLDFTIIDRDVVWLLLLDGGRRIRAGTLHFDETMNNRFGEVFRLMWDTATPLPVVAAERA